MSDYDKRLKKALRDGAYAVTDWERGFVKSILRNKRPLTSKQHDAAYKLINRGEQAHRGGLTGALLLAHDKTPVKSATLVRYNNVKDELAWLQCRIDSMDNCVAAGTLPEDFDVDAACDEVYQKIWDCEEELGRLFDQLNDRLDTTQ